MKRLSLSRKARRLEKSFRLNWFSIAQRVSSNRHHCKAARTGVPRTFRFRRFKNNTEYRRLSVILSIKSHARLRRAKTKISLLYVKVI